MGFQPILQVINLFPWSVGVVFKRNIWICPTIGGCYQLLKQGERDIFDHYTLSFSGHGLFRQPIFQSNDK